MSPIMKRNRLLRVELALLIAGALCLAIYAGARLHSAIGHTLALERFDVESGHTTGDSGVTSGSLILREDSTDFSLWSEKRMAAYKETLLMKFDAPLAVLSIPKIKLHVPVFDGTDDLILNRGAGRIQGTAMPGDSGNIGIAAHRDGFFRSLKDVDVGDTLKLATFKGTITYAIDDIEIVFPDNVTVLQPRGRPSVTLVTCYPFYFIGDAPQRYIVHASEMRDDRPASTASVQRAPNSSTEVAR